MTIKIEDGEIKINIADLFSSLSETQKQELLEMFCWDEIIPMCERQLKGDTDFWGWDTSGGRHGDKLREAILNFQGIEPEFKKDLEAQLKAEKRDKEHYKKFYDWYFELYHHKNYSGDNEIFTAAINAIGDCRN